MAQTIDIQADMSSAIAAAQQFANALNGQNAAAINVATGLVRINQVTGEMEQTIRGVTESGAKFTSVLTGTAGAMSLLRTTIEPAKAGFKDLSGTMDDTGKAAKKMGENLLISPEGIIRLLQSQVIRQGFKAIEAQFIEGIKSAADYSTAIAKAQTVANSGSTSSLSGSTRALSEQFATPQTDVAAAQYAALQSQQGDVTKSQTLLTAALKLGQVTSLSAVESTKLLATTLAAYKLPVTEAERVSAQLFQTIKSGLITPQELASGLEKIGPLAQSMGIKIEEVNAAIISLTSKGVSGSQAVGLLSSIIAKGAQPTEQMTKLLKENGASSLSALIGLKGFGGYLAILDKESQSGNTRLGELTSQLKGVRTAAGLAGGAFADYQKNLDKVNSGSDDYNKAAKTIKDSLGKEIQSEFNKVKNFFADDIGNVFLANVVTLSKAIAGDDGLVGAIKKIGPALFLAAAALTSFKSATLGVAGVGFGAGLLIGDQLFNNGPTVDDINKQAGSQEQKRQQSSVQTSTDAGQKQADDSLVKSTQDAYNQRYQIILQYAAKVFQVADDLKKRAVDNLKTIEDQVKITGKTFTDSISKGIQDLNKKITEAQSQIKQSLKQSEDLQRQADSAVYGIRSKYADDGSTSGGVNQKAILIANQLGKTIARAREEFAKGTKEGATEARKLYNDAEKLLVQQFDTATDLAKKNGEAEIKATGFTQQPGFTLTAGTDGKLRWEYTVQTSQAEQKINDLLRERQAMEEQLRAREAEKKAILEQQAVAEKERLRTIVQGLEQAAKFKVTDDTGKIQKKYQDDPALAARQFDEIITKIKSSATDSELSKNFQIFNDLYRQKAAIAQQIEAQITAEQAKAYQERAGQDKRAADARITAQKASLDTAKSDFDKAEQALAQFLAVNQQKVIGDGAKTGLSGLLPDSFSNPGGNFTAETSPELAAARSAQTSVSQAKAALDANKTTANAEILLQKLKELKTAVEEYYKAVGKNTAEPVAGDNTSVDTRLRSGVQTGQNILDALKKQEEARQALEANKQTATGLDKTLAGIPDSLKLLGTAATTNGKILNDSLTLAGTNVTALIGLYDQLVQRIAAVGAAVPQASGNRDVGAVVAGVGDNVNGQFYGGVVHMSGGGFVARGSDNIPAMLAKGEYVVNADSTAQFLPQLQAMNAKQAPQYFNSGGQVSNVGDIHVHVNGGNSSPQTIKEIAAGLRRELRRGSVTLK